MKTTGNDIASLSNAWAPEQAGLEVLRSAIELVIHGLKEGEIATEEWNLTLGHDAPTYYSGDTSTGVVFLKWLVSVYTEKARSVDAMLEATLHPRA